MIDIVVEATLRMKGLAEARSAVLTQRGEAVAIGSKTLATGMAGSFPESDQGSAAVYSLSVTQ